MTQPISRRAFARAALFSAAGAALAASQVSAQTPPAAPPPLPLPQPPLSRPAPSEGDALTQAVPASAGFTLTPAQQEEVAKALKGYPGDFAKARAYHLDSDIAPAVVPLPPLSAPPTSKKGRAR